jgi:predicted ATP-grasp superfamily ATP-dependent carboligase
MRFAAGQESGVAVSRSRHPPKIMLLDAYSTRTLACVRSWGRRGIEFAVGGETWLDMSLHSRYAKEKFVYASPKRDMRRFIEDINHYGMMYSTKYVLPTSEAAILACSKYRDEICCDPIIPGEREVDLTFNKANTLEVARKVGVPVPETLQLRVGDWESLERGRIRFPVVLKSGSSHRLDGNRSRTSGGSVYLLDRMSLKKECAARFRNGESVLVQEFIDGYGVGISGLFEHGRPIALIGHRRVRESDPRGGPSAVAETIAVDGELLRSTRSLFEAIGFTGPAMAEYKVDRQSCRPYLMEINGRLWGTVLLAYAAGLDLPYLYWKLLVGDEIRCEEVTYEVGMRGRFVIGDTKWLALCLLGKPRSWPGDFPTRTEAVSSYVRSFFDSRSKDLLLTRKDPVPFFARLLRSVW